MRRLTAIEAEFCEALGQLRYLSSEQIHALWFGDRGFEAFKRRLRHLRTAGYLRSARRHIGEKALAWRLGGKALRQLRELGRELHFYQDVRPQFLEHLLDTNRVWSALAGLNPVWSDLPFEWTGSHKARFEFVSLERSRRRNRYVNPDALITANRGGSRIFLELDRNTEGLRERPGQRSIVGKLKAYEAAFLLPRPGGRRSAYDAEFRDGRRPKVVFVLSRDKHGAREEAIATTATEATPNLDVTCIQLGDAASLRALVAVPPHPAAGEVADDGTDPPLADDHDREVLRMATSFYRAALFELKGAGVSARSFPELAELQRAVRRQLESPPNNIERLVGGTYRRFFRECLDVLERRRSRREWSKDLLAAEREIRPILRLGHPSREHQGMQKGELS